MSQMKFIDAKLIAQLPRIDVWARMPLRQACLTGTRENLLAIIHSHFTMADSHSGDYCGMSRQSIWLQGSAGSGKSSVATTVAGGLYKQNRRLAAVLFFDKGSRGCGTLSLKHIINSIAFQMSSLSLDFHIALGQSLERGISTLSSVAYLQKLVLGLLGRVPLSIRETWVTVIDALDECGTPAEVSQLIQLLAKCSEMLVRFFVTSRLEKGICVKMEDLSNIVVENLDDIDPRSTERDIRKYVHSEVYKLKAEYDSDWPPSENQITVFAALSGGIFEIAAIHIRQLRASTTMGSPYSEVFRFIICQCEAEPNNKRNLQSEYKSILRAAYPATNMASNEATDNYSTYAETLMKSPEPLGIKAFADLHYVHPVQVRMALAPLHCVLMISEDNITPVIPYHTSFHDFMRTLPITPDSPLPPAV